MKIKTGTFEGMANDVVVNDNRIVVYGLGVVGMTITPSILHRYGLMDRVAYCVDGDSGKWGKNLNLGEKPLHVFSPDVLKEESVPLTILVTASRFWGIVDTLDSFPNSVLFSCYIVPELCVGNFSAGQARENLRKLNHQRIPKKIHYMWFGGKMLPEKLQYCVDTWKKYCPDYEIIRWDETNYDVHKNIFVSQAYDNGMFGFVPDYARLELLYEYGGIYLDTDVELVRNLDELLYQDAFCGVEKWQVLNFGGCSGAVKGHESLEPFLEEWEKRRLIREDGSVDRISSGLIDTSVAIRQGYQISGENQSVNGMNIYTYDYFHPYDYMSGKIDRSENTFSIHHFNGGWLDEEAQKDSRRRMLQHDDFFAKAIRVE